VKSYNIYRRKLQTILKRAIKVAKKDGHEICGLIAANGRKLELIECRNKVKRGGSFAFYYGEVRKLVKETELLDQSIVGTFHSHPVSLAIPGESDIRNAEDDSLMLIIDCTNRNAKLWHIVNQKAKEVRIMPIS